MHALFKNLVKDLVNLDVPLSALRHLCIEEMQILRLQKEQWVGVVHETLMLAFNQGFIQFEIRQGQIVGFCYVGVYERYKCIGSTDILIHDDLVNLIDRTLDHIDNLTLYEGLKKRQKEIISSSQVN